MLFLDLKKYPLRSLDGLAEVARKMRTVVHAPGPLLVWVRLYSANSLSAPKGSKVLPSGPVVALVHLALGMLRLAQHAFEELPGDVSFSEWVNTIAGRESKFPGRVEETEVVRQGALQALGLEGVGGGGGSLKPTRPRGKQRVQKRRKAKT